MAWGSKAINRRRKGITSSRSPERGLNQGIKLGGNSKLPSSKGINQRSVTLTKSKLPSSRGINQRYAAELRRGIGSSPPVARKGTPVLSSSNITKQAASRNFTSEGGGLSGQPPPGGGFQTQDTEEEFEGTSFQAPGQSLEQQAKDLMELEFGPKKSALQRAIEAARKQFAIEETAQKGFGDIHDKRLQEIYNALTGQLQQGQGARQQIYDSSSNAISGILDQAKGSVEGASKDAQTSLEEMAKRLGLEAGVRDPAAKLSGDAAALTGLLSAEKSNRLSGLQAEKANQLNFGQGGIDLSNREQAAKRTDLSQSVLKAIQELGIDRTEAENEYQGQLADLAALEGPQLRKTIQELTEAQRQSEMEEFAKKIQLATLNIQKGRLGLDTLGKQQDFALGTARLGIDQARLGLESQKMQLEQERATTDDPLRRAKLEADIRNIDSQIASRGPSGSTAKYGKAQIGLDAFVKDKANAGAIKNPGRFRSSMATIISEVDRLVGSEFNPTGKNRDPYTEAVRIINRSAKSLKISSNLLKQAAAIYYGKA